MSCIKNPKKWLFFRWNGSHDNRPVHISVFMKGNEHFIVKYECSKCGCPTTRNFVEWEELLDMGFTNEQLKEIQWSFFGKSLK